MPFYKDTPQNRKLNRVGKPYGKDSNIGKGKGIEKILKDRKMKSSKSKSASKKPSKPVTDKDEFLDILNIASQVGKSKGKSTKGKIEGKAYENKLKSRINNIGGKVSFKLFDDVLTWVDTFGDMRNKIHDNLIKYGEIVYDEEGFADLDFADTGLEEHDKGFYKEEIKGKVWTFNTLKKEIKKKYNSQSYPTF